MQQLLGIGIVLACVFGGYFLGGGVFQVIWRPVEVLIIAGAGIGAIFLGNPWHVLQEMRLQLKDVVFRRRQHVGFQRELLLLMYELLLTARSGLKALDNNIENPHDSAPFNKYPLVLQRPKLLAFIVDNFRLMAMGKISPHELEGVLDQELEAIQDDLEQPSRSIERIAEAMPGFGIVAAVMGIVMALSSIQDGASAAEIGVHVAGAMVGTFIGIFFCYGVLDPIALLLKQLVKEEMGSMECVKVVLVTHVAGKPPLLAIDAGRRVTQLNVKPSFAQLEGWIGDLQSSGPVGV